MSHGTLFESLIQSVIRRVGQVTGTSVQVYSEDLIGDMIQHKFDVLFEEQWWTQFMRWRTVTLDGTTGVPTISMRNPPDGKGLQRFEDIHSAFVTNSNRPLPRFPDFVNPDTVKGSTPRFLEIDASDEKVFHVYPITATGTINVHYRELPDNFVTGAEVDFDNQALILGAAFDYLSSDGTNPSATDDMKDMFESRIKQLKKSRAWLPHALDPRVEDTVDDWFET